LATNNNNTVAGVQSSDTESAEESHTNNWKNPNRSTPSTGGSVEFPGDDEMVMLQEMLTSKLSNRNNQNTSNPSGANFQFVGGVKMFQQRFQSQPPANVDFDEVDDAFASRSLQSFDRNQFRSEEEMSGSTEPPKETWHMVSEESSFCSDDTDPEPMSGFNEAEEDGSDDTPTNLRPFQHSEFILCAGEWAWSNGL